jgi:hypothetical protein
LNEGQVLVASISAADDLRRGTPAEIAAEISRRVQVRLGIPPASRILPVWQPRATLRVAPGSERLRPSAATAVRGLYLAGDWTATGWPASLEGAARSGKTAALLLLRSETAGGP